ncbi:hypothetical protein GOP47_0022234 [Adiantum capillus-veneris]|uniref:Uncharacterized protein n=1 Tax=Adiantum capillus-veneris TaxID=13818 RepID=A0A9D4U9U3_ADICA|nr:hypothetical protein GOP47_0022234 [Adiantum capillus-veneris]
MDNHGAQQITPTSPALDTTPTVLAAPPLPGFVSATTVLLAESSSTLVPPTHSPTSNMALLPGNPHALDHYEHIAEELEKLPEDSFDFSSVLAKNGLDHNHLSATLSSALAIPRVVKKPMDNRKKVSTSSYPPTISVTPPQLKKPVNFEVILSNSILEFKKLHGKLGRAKGFLAQLNELIRHQKAPKSLCIKPQKLTIDDSQAQALLNAKLASVTIQFQLNSTQALIQAQTILINNLQSYLDGYHSLVEEHFNDLNDRLLLISIPLLSKQDWSLKLT